MGRLIDASNLNFEGQNYNKSQMKAILDFIDAQPTAYNVEKVMAELEKAKSIIRIFDFESQKPIGLISLDNAIDIVRKGGVE